MEPPLKTPLTLAVLTNICADQNWTQSTLEKATGIERSTISHHRSGERPVRDKHLIKYLSAVPASDRPRLLAAWLRDTQVPETLDVIFPPGSNLMDAKVADWQPSLSDTDRTALEWLASEMLRDSELADMIRTLIRRLGHTG